MKFKKAWFMFNKMLNDFRNPGYRYDIAKDVHSELLGEYYFVFKEERIAQGKDQALIKRFDENGIPINKTYIDVTDKDYVYFPISIGQMGLSIFTTYINSKSENDKQRFLKFVDWFYYNSEESDGLGIRWMTDVSLPAYGNPGPWQSAFSQARGISILLRGYQLTGEEKYKVMAEKALLPFIKPASEGGITSYTSWGPIYEEYTSTFPTLVLNGHIFALFGIYDFVRVFPENKLAKQIWDDGVCALKKALPDYDLGWWTRYNYCQDASYPAIDPATIKYQNLHISQLEVIAKITGDSTFSEYAKKWESYLNTWNYLKSYILKYKALKKIGRL